MHRGDFELHKSTVFWIRTRISRLSHVKLLNERIKRMNHGFLVGKMTIIEIKLLEAVTFFWQRA